MANLKRPLMLATIVLITYAVSCTSDSSCARPTYRKIELSLANRKNDTGHWITDLEAAFKGETPKDWKINVEGLVTECDGDREVRLKARVSVPPPRPKDYEYFPGIGYYKFHTDLRTFDEAKSNCEEENSHLAILNSEDESQVLKEMFLRQPKGVDWAFVGFHDRYDEGEYVTIFGEPLNSTGFTRWFPGEPNSARGNEDCGSINRNGGLNDDECEHKLYFICEYELW